MVCLKAFQPIPIVQNKKVGHMQGVPQNVGMNECINYVSLHSCNIIATSFTK